MNVIKNNIYKLFTSLRLTIFLLSFIAAASIFGTLIRQKGDIEEYLTLYPERVFRIIHFFGFDDIYHSPWFLASLLLFAVNLGLCTLGRLNSFRKVLKTPSKLPDEQSLSAMPMHFSLATNSFEHAIKIVKHNYRNIFQDESGAIFEKGTPARYGPYIIHISILVILAGSLIGLIFGYKGYVILNKGEPKNTIALRGKGNKELPLGFNLRCRDFRVSFYPGGEPKDYVSRVEIIENKGIVAEKDIRVNDPLHYKGVYIYQASYGINPSFIFNIDGDEVELKESDTYEKDDLVLMIVRFESAIDNLGPGVQVRYLDQDELKTAWFFKNVEGFKEIDVQDTKIRLEDIREHFYTGLEVSRDPGLWVVWTGFAFILMGLYINFFMYYRMIYIRKTPCGTIVAGHALKNRDAFGEEFEKLKRRVSGQ